VDFLRNTVFKHSTNTSFRITTHHSKYSQDYIGRPENWLRDWKIAINDSKSKAMLPIKAVERIQNPRTENFLGEAIQWVQTARYLGVTLDTQLTWSAHVKQLGKKTDQRLGVLGSLLNRRMVLPVRNGVLLNR
jgi:hypothetical protein